MKDQFIQTKNVKRFRIAADRIHHPNLKGITRMALIFGDPGLGKTETALQYAANNGALYVRMKKLMSARWLLKELVDRLGGSPSRWTEELFNQVIDMLQKKKRTLILDEVDYFTSDSKVTETLRDIHDIAGTPMLFLGMSQADKRLKRYPHLYDRFVDVVRFQPLDREDLELIMKELSEMTFEPDAIEWILSETEGKIRKALALIHRGENIASRNRLRSISRKDFR